MRYLCNKYVITAIILGIITYIGLLSATLILESDPSVEPSVICNNKVPGKVWLISYADGSDVNFMNQRYQIKSAVNKCVDYYKPYNVSDINPEYKKAHANILSQKVGGGYWLWKPYIILKTMEEVPEGDIVFYMDAGVALHKPIDSLISRLADRDIIIFQSIFPSKPNIKRDLLKMMDADNEEVRGGMDIQASYIMLRNNQHARDFVKKWLSWCENERAITDLPSSDEYPEFVVHRHDQSILTILYHKHKDEIDMMPSEVLGEYFLHHRRRQYKAAYPLSILEDVRYHNRWLVKLIYNISLKFKPHISHL